MHDSAFYHTAKSFCIYRHIIPTYIDILYRYAHYSICFKLSSKKLMSDNKIYHKYQAHYEMLQKTRILTKLTKTDCKTVEYILSKSFGLLKLHRNTESQMII